ncbi:putative P' protein [Cytorhabdovirus fragariarugosus]|nr:putative P' protein [Cytorhabdovirus fragariarugosus]
MSFHQSINTPEIIFKSITTFINPTCLRWLILILVISQILNWISICLMSAKMILRMIWWMILMMIMLARMMKNCLIWMNYRKKMVMTMLMVMMAMSLIIQMLRKI